MDQIRIIIRYDNKDYTLPVNPSELKITWGGNNAKTNTLKLGQISILREKSLRTLSIDSFFPAQPDYSFIINPDEFKPPKFYLRLLTKIRDEKRPFMLIIPVYQICFYCSIESFAYGYMAGSDDLEYSLSLSEYKPYGRTGTELNLIDEQDVEERTYLYENRKAKRQSNGFAIGDKVIVNGQYWRDAWGGIPFIHRSLHVATMPISVASYSLAALKDVPPPLVNAECVIISVEQKGTIQPIITEFKINPLYPYKIADSSRKSLGWVSGEQLIKV